MHHFISQSGIGKTKITILCILLAVLVVNFSYGKEYQTEDSIYVANLFKHVSDSPLLPPTRVLEIGNDILAYSTKKNYIDGIIRGYIRIGVAKGNLGKTIESIQSFQKAATMADEYNFTRYEAQAQNGLGQTYERLGINDKAFECYSKSLSLYQTLKDSFKIALGYQCIGYGLIGMDKYKDALQYYMYSLEMFKSLRKINELVGVYSDIASVYGEQNKFKDAFQYLYEAVRLADSLNDPEVDPYINMACCYEALKKYDSSIYYLNKALKGAKTTYNKEEEATVYVNLGNIYMKLNQINLAEYHYKSALVLYKDISSTKSILSVYNHLADLYETKKNFTKAYNFKSLAYSINDSMVNKAKEMAMASMQIKFEVKELGNKLKLLQNQNEIDQIKLKQKDTIVFLSLGVVALLSVLIWQIIRHNRLKVNQRLLLLEQKQLLAQMNPHFIFNCLNSIQQYVVQNDAENANKYLADFALLMRQTLDNSRDGNIPLKREIDYLENYLSLESMRFENKFKYSIICSEGVNANTVEIPSMIIQPFVENAIHHGLRNLENKEGFLNINFYIKSSALICEVEDNGIGMEESQKLKEKSFIKYQSHGMDLTRQRLALVSKLNSADYQIAVESKTNIFGKSEGTKIIIKFPMKA